MAERIPQDVKERLTPEQYEVCVNKGTEAPFSGEHLSRKDDGTYLCVCCGRKLFGSDTKFESGTGWPSFSGELPESGMEHVEDRGYGMTRTEVNCGGCGAHLGHVFDDGPGPDGLRYCINSLSLDFKKSVNGS